MNPSFDKLPSLDSNVPVNGGEVGQTQAQEQPRPFPEHVQSIESAPEFVNPSSVLPVNPSGFQQPSAPAPMQPAMSVAATTPGAGSVADDSDITKQYVEKAKAIVEQTANDPYQQSLQIGRLRSDYDKRLGRFSATKST